MARGNYNGDAREKATVTIYPGTGYTVDHIPYSPDDLQNFDAYTQECTFLNSYGLASCRLAGPAWKFDNVDYCRITISSAVGRNDPATAFPKTFGVAKEDMYFFVTGVTAKNGGVVDLSLSIDYVTTLGGVTACLDLFGGVVTRAPAVNGVPFNAGSELVDYSEGFTFSRPVVRYSTTIRAREVMASSVTLILSPYDLNYNNKTVSGTRTGTGKTSGTGTTTPGDSSSRTESTAEETTNVTISYATAKANAYTTLTAIGNDTLSEHDLGVSAYKRSQGLLEYVSQLYAAGISNAIADAYTICGYSATDPGASSFSKITGKTAVKQVSLKGGDITTRKRDYIGRGFILFARGSGEMQYVAAKDIEGLDSDHDISSISVDFVSDPDPTGCVRARIRTKQQGDPSWVCGSQWRKAQISLTNNGGGVSLGQTFKEAYLKLDQFTAAANASAAAVQYDLTAGNNYLLNNASNTYEKNALAAKNNYDMATYRTTASRTGQDLAISGVSTIGSALMSASNTTDDGGGKGSVADSAFGFLSSARNLQNSAMSLNYSAESAGITAQRLADSGAYNRELLIAQADQSRATNAAAVQRSNLLLQELYAGAEVPTLVQGTRGTYSGADEVFLLMEVDANPVDLERFDEYVNNFGLATYAPATYSPPTGSPRFTFWSYSIPGMTTYTGLPGWMTSGAIAQLSSGLWISQISKT
jgi:hypothetical protein